MKAVAQFVATAFGIYIAWYIIHDFYLLPHTTFVIQLTEFETKLSSNTLNLLGLKDSFSQVGTMIFCNGRKALRIGEECNALVLFVLFAGFIISFPGNWKSKAWFIPVGIFLIFIINILRIVVLTINFKYYHSSFSFNHHVTFTYLVYTFIFFLWMFWVNKLSRKTAVN